MNEPATLVPLAGSKFTNASSTITGRHSARWPNSRISPNRSARNSCSRGAPAQLLGCLNVARGVHDIDLGTAKGRKNGLVRAIRDVQEETLGMADHIRLPFLLELALRPLDERLGNRADGPIPRVPLQFFGQAITLQPQPRRIFLAGEPVERCLDGTALGVQFRPLRIYLFQVRVELPHIVANGLDICCSQRGSERFQSIARPADPLHLLHSARDVSSQAGRS